MLAETGRILRKRSKLQAREDEGLKQGQEREKRGIPDREVGCHRLVTEPRGGGGGEESETT